MPIDTKHLEYEKALPDWKRNRAVVEGERAIKAAGTTYLPRLSGQGYKYKDGSGVVDEYDCYKDRASFFPATSRTLDGLTGLIFRKAPQADLPAAIEGYADDIDMRGQSLDEFAQKVVDDVMQAPHGGVLVEFPQTDGADATRAQADAAGWRPYLTYWPAEAVLNWKTGRVNNHTVLVEVRLYETAEAPDPTDPWKSKVEERIRLLRMNEGGAYEVVLFRRLKDASGATTWIADAPLPMYFRGQPETIIPFIFVGPRDTSPEVQKAPLTDIASVNVAHYRNSADYENGLHWVGVPTPCFFGTFQTAKDEDVAEVKLGSSTGIRLAQNDDAKFLEFQGEGLRTLERAMLAKEEQMAVLGARILAPEKKQTEAAETAAIHRAGENSVLASLAGAVSKAIVAALRIMARWSGDESSDVSYKLCTDYQVTALSGQDLLALVESWIKGGISKRDLYENLQRGEIVRDDKSFEDHEAELEEESEARAARDEEKSQSLLARTAAMIAAKGKAT